MTNEDGTVVENTIEDQAEVIFGEKHLRRRPFLIITEIARPAQSAKTEKKNWMEEPGQLSRFESPLIVDSVNKRHLSEAALILDVLNRKIVKNRYADMGTEEQFVAHYTEKYAEQITQGLRIWAQRSALNIASKKETA